MRIQYKIVIPYTLLFVAATFVTALVSISFVTRDLEAKVDAQIDQSSMLLSRADFALNPAILASLKAVIGADIMTCSADGKVLATTLTPSRSLKALPVVLSTDAPARILSGDSPFIAREATIDGIPYKIAYRRVASTPKAYIVVLNDTSALARTRNQVATLLLLIATLMVVLMALIGHRIARSVTGPVLRLVDFSNRIAAGDRSQAPITSGDEVGLLAAAFNDMVEQLRKSEERVLQSEKLALTGLLAARTAHDVRNPLSAIRIQAQLLQSKIKSRGDESEKELIGSVLQGIDRLEGVVRGMLDLASPQVLHLESEDIREVVNDVLDHTGPQLRHRKITVRKTFDPVIPRVRLDRNRFKRALLNLVVNAAEAITDGGILEVSAARVAAGDRVRIVIADNGSGIDPSIQDRLFDPFVTTKNEGVGLGLVNTRNTVEAHHGTVTLLPREGGGTQAVIELPIDEKAEVKVSESHG